MNKILNYLKYIAIYILIVLGIAIFTSLINMSGLKSVTINKISIILTALSFFIIAALASSQTKEKGYIKGLKMGFVCVVLLILLNLIFFQSGFKIDRLIYYIILISSSILGGAFGKNIHLKKRKK